MHLAQASSIFIPPLHSPPKSLRHCSPTLSCSAQLADDAASTEAGLLNAAPARTELEAKLERQNAEIARLEKELAETKVGCVCSMCRCGCGGTPGCCSRVGMGSRGSLLRRVAQACACERMAAANSLLPCGL